MKEIPTHYDQSKEAELYQLWESSGYFSPEGGSASGGNPDLRKPFTIMMPPPNVTGTLHVGHALFLTLQDILIRYQRMLGKKTLWLPGTDHATIATAAKVESILYKEEGKTRHDIGRMEFEKRATKFAQESHDTIVHQIRQMGASCDWSREAYTLDEPRSLAVRTAFKKMYDAGLVYRGARIVNWDPKLKTNVSDDEIEWKEEKAPFYYLKYGPFTIATARPETKFGDKYVVMHPKDARYKKYKDGEQFEVEWINGKVLATVIKDEAVDPEFGSGVMTITPWHDAADFEIAQRHKLDAEQIIDDRGVLLPIAGEFAGQHIKKARPMVVEKLKSKSLLEKIDENYVHRIATNSRGGGIIEPQIKEQWFIDVNKVFRDGKSLKQWMRDVVANGRIQIIPKHLEKTYFHWIDNLRDWCVSRQLWFGHQIPVWYKKIETEKKMGFAGDIVSQVFNTKTRTYRLRDHGFSIGDIVAFEDSSKTNIFGYGTITEIKKTTVGEIDLQDKKHWKTYEKLEDLIKAFKRHHPQKEVNQSTPAWLYTYKFAPAIYVNIDPPKEKGWTQDPDTLDTWFSSGLWTFSALGWPNQTADLKMFHPTDILETGYDILFFWVARMILMTGFLLNDIPFKTVYLHGLVRDKDRQKMSKSKGNIVDPLGITDQYGVDALRMALTVNNLPGSDLPLSEDKVRGYRNFANKIWNAARFVIQNTDGLNKDSKLNKEDQVILKQLDELIKDTTKLMDKFDFAHAAENLYHYFWHTFADKIIEEAKPKLADEKTKGSAQFMLKTVLETNLKLLHPFMPFVTETIWQMEHKELLMIAKWPESSLNE